MSNPCILGNPDLPIFNERCTLKQIFSDNQVIFVQGSTGCGKSTQIPQFCLEWLNENHHGKELGKILVTQPRRMATISLATHLSHEIRLKKGSIPWLDNFVSEKKPTLKKTRSEVKNGFRLGGVVGYNIRFERLESALTSIKFVTDGVLLRMLLTSPKLPEYKIIVIDEAHERSVRTDVCLSRLKLLLKDRVDLKLIIMSATMDTEVFMDIFSEFRQDTISVVGRTFPLESYNLATSYELQSDCVGVVAQSVIQVHMTMPEGGILCFLPGKAEIRRCHQILDNHRSSLQILEYINKKKTDEITLKPNVDTMPRGSYAVTLQHLGLDEKCYTNTEALKLEIMELFAGQPYSKQQIVFEPPKPGYRRIILATNIAETSLTVPNVRYVVDSGVQKVKTFYPSMGMEVLNLEFCSKAQLTQRLGRAGRVSSGVGFCMIPHSILQYLDDDQSPEIARSDLSEILLQLIASNIDVLSFPWVTKPDVKYIYRGLATLNFLGCIDTEAHLTTKGRIIKGFPLQPMLANIIYESVAMGCIMEVCQFVSLLEAKFELPSVGNMNRRLRTFWNSMICPDCDAMTMVNIFNVYRESEDKKSLAKALEIDFRALNLADKIYMQTTDIVKKMFKLDAISSCRPETNLVASLSNSKYTDQAESIDYLQWWDPVRRCIFRALYKFRVAKIASTSDDPVPLNGENTPLAGMVYMTLSENILAKIHPTSALFGGIRQATKYEDGMKVKRIVPKFVCFCSLIGSTNVYLDILNVVEDAWIIEDAPDVIKVD